MNIQRRLVRIANIQKFIAKKTSLAAMFVLSFEISFQFKMLANRNP
jgi:hypothetical protein